VRPDQILVDHLAFGATLGLHAAGIPYSDVVLGHPTALPVGDEAYGSLATWPMCCRPESDELEELHRLCKSVSGRFTDDWNRATRQVAGEVSDVDDAFAVHGQHVMFNYPAELHDPRRQALVDAQIGAHTFLGACVREDEIPHDVAAWLGRVGGRPVVYVSFGSFLSARGDVLAKVADALRGMDVDVMLATGSTDAAALGDLPAHWLVRPFLPQVACLPRATVAVTHGGNNSVTECLHHGVPMLVLPFSTDQFAGAASVERHGSGIALAPNTCTATDLIAGITTLLTGRYGSVAAALGDRLRATPGPDVAFAAMTR
jgi:MGT family glycosyltransferase